MRKGNAILLLLLLLTGGCDKQAPLQAIQNTDQSIERKFALGGAPVEVFITLSAESIELTDFLTVAVRVEHAEDVRIEAPYLSEAVYAPLLLVQAPKEDLQWSESKSRIVKSWQYRFEPVTSGEFNLNAFNVFFRLESERKSAEGEWPVYRIETEAVPYRVTSVTLEDQADIRDIRDPILPPYNYLPPIFTALGIAIVLLAFQVIVGFRKRIGKTDASAENPVDYRIESLKRLEELERKGYISRREFERLHVELSSIMRYFIENRFTLRALEQTTEEFIRDIQYSPHFDLEQQAILHQFLKLADLVKFATYDPGSSASQQAVKTVRHFIESTGGK